MGFVTDSGLTALVMSVVVVLIVAGLTGLLAWRNVQAERRIGRRDHAPTGAGDPHPDLRRAGARSRAADAEEAGPGPGDGERRRSLRRQAGGDLAARAAMARTLPARIASTAPCMTIRPAWRSIATRCPTCSPPWHRERPSTSTRPGTTGVRRSCSQATWQPLEISSVYIAPILMAGRLLGMLTVEDPQRGDHAAGLATFCDALSIVLALRFTAVAAPAPVASRATVVADRAAASRQRGRPARQLRPAPDTSRTHPAAAQRADGRA